MKRKIIVVGCLAVLGLALTGCNVEEKPFLMRDEQGHQWARKPTGYAGFANCTQLADPPVNP